MKQQHERRAVQAVSILSALFISSAVSPVRAGSGCSTGTLDDNLKHPDVVAIFTGTVTAVQQVPPSLTFPRDRRQIGTMNVTRVWKGDITSTTALHLWITESSSTAGLQIGTEYLVKAYELDADARQWFRLPRTGERALGANGLACSVMPIDSPSAVRVISAAPGYPPK